MTIEAIPPLEGSQVSFVVAAGEFLKAENPIHQEQTEVEEDCPKVVFPIESSARRSKKVKKEFQRLGSVF